MDSIVIGTRPIIILMVISPSVSDFISHDDLYGSLMLVSYSFSLSQNPIIVSLTTLIVCNAMN